MVNVGIPHGYLSHITFKQYIHQSCGTSETPATEEDLRAAGTKLANEYIGFRQDDGGAVGGPATTPGGLCKRNILQGGGVEEKFWVEAVNNQGSTLEHVVGVNAGISTRTERGGVIRSRWRGWKGGQQRNIEIKSTYRWTDDTRVDCNGESWCRIHQ